MHWKSLIQKAYQGSEVNLKDEKICIRKFNNRCAPAKDKECKRIRLIYMPDDIDFTAKNLTFGQHGIK